MKQYIFKFPMTIGTAKDIPAAVRAKIEAELKEQSVCVYVNELGDVVSFSVYNPEYEKPQDIRSLEDDRERVINILATMPGYTPEQAQVLMYAAKIAASDHPYDYIPAEMARSLATKVLPKTRPVA